VLGDESRPYWVQADLARLAAYAIRWKICGTRSPAPTLPRPRTPRRRATGLTIARQRSDRGRRAYKPIIMAYAWRAGHIGDVAYRRRAGERSHGAGTRARRPSSSISSGSPAHRIDVVSQIRAEIPKVQRAIPAGVNLTVVSDRPSSIRASVHDVQFTLILRWCW